MPNQIKFKKSSELIHTPHGKSSQILVYFLSKLHLGKEKYQQLTGLTLCL
ncbi:hypothetical protein CRENPOLYSF1_200089 [Crenothrix polyspora]|uniref:Uncharacterized protein n=1 Tax=Crenothrix polyspora TaxID=360316 RepID=A0A1R4H7F0_9GAMM|nr:hypothetical protein CRENPOLYSF1_200089 [Crenothrix polyspora]